MVKSNQLNPKLISSVDQIHSIINVDVNDIKFESREFELLWDLVVCVSKHTHSDRGNSPIVLGCNDNDYLLPLDIAKKIFSGEHKYAGWIDAAAWSITQKQYDLAAYALRRALELRPSLTAKFLMMLLRLVSKAGQTAATLWCAVRLVSIGQHKEEIMGHFALAARDMESGLGSEILDLLLGISPSSQTLRLALAERKVLDGDLSAAKQLLVGISADVIKDPRCASIVQNLNNLTGFCLHNFSQILNTQNITASECVAWGRNLLTKNELRQSERCFARGLALASKNSERVGILSILAGFPAPVPQPKSLPLVMISQVQRSGGSLLAQLFDSHHQVLAHPHEIHIGHPLKWHWPNLDLRDTATEWMSHIFELPLVDLVLNGMRKPDSNSYADKIRFDFDLHFGALVSLFHKLLAKRSPTKQREVLDAYFNAFFESWAGLSRSGQERWISGFTPRMLSNTGSMERFWRDYPDGFLITLVRNPLNWYASCQRHNGEYFKIEHAIEMWRTSTLTALYQAERNSSRSHLTTYEALVSDPEREMRVIASRLGIDFVPSLVEPTFMGKALLPNSSFDIQTTGVHKKSLHSDNLLTQSQRNYIELEAMDLYKEAVRLAEIRRDEFNREVR